MLDAIFGMKDHVTVAQECTRAVVIFIYGLIALRVSGKRTFARWSALDIVISIVVGSNLSRAITGNAPMPGTMAAVAVLVALHWIAAQAVARSQFWSRLLEGAGVTLGEDGTVDDDVRKHHAVSCEDLREALHQKGIESAEQTSRVRLEANGKISLQHKIDPAKALAAIAKGMAETGGKPAPPLEDAASEK